MIRSVLTVLLIFILVQGWAQKSKKPALPQGLFSVANRSVSTDEFIYLYRKNHQNKSEDYTKPKIDEYLALFINFKLKVEEARTRGLDTTKVFQNEFNSYKEELRRPYLPEGKMVDSLVRLTYDRLKEEVRASHILIGTKPDALPADTLEAYKRILDIKSRALAGEDFGTLAATLSEDPSARSNQGDLGYFTALQMVYPFESAAFQGKPGEVVGPVKTRFGYHLLKIQDRKPARGEVEVSHIMIRVASENEADRAKKVIFDIYDELKGGIAWEELCAQYSDDVSSKNNGGRLRPFGVGAMATVPEFDQVAFSLEQPGDVSDPFQTAYGWHIVRLEQKIPLPIFEEIAPALKARVQRDERVQISRQALVARLKREYSFKENMTVKTQLFALADSSLSNGRWSVAKQPEAEVLFSIKSRSVSANDFIRYVKEQQRKSTVSPEAYITQLYTSFVESVINQAYEDELVRTNPDYEMLLREYYEGILLFDIMEKEVWNKASNDSTGQRIYFNEHASAYVAGERVQAEIYSSTSSENMEELSALLQKRDSSGVAENIKARKVRLEKGIYQTNDRPVLAKVERKVGDYSVENKGMYYLVRILQLISPGPMTFEEAKASVISDYQNHLEKVWVEELAKKYPVKINEKGKQYMYKELVRP